MEDKLKQTISKNLARERAKQRYTQRQIAEKAGLDMNYYAKIERGESIPSIKTLKKIAKVFNVTATDILGF